MTETGDSRINNLLRDLTRAIDAHYSSTKDIEMCAMVSALIAGFDVDPVVAMRARRAQEDNRRGRGEQIIQETRALNILNAVDARIERIIETASEVQEAMQEGEKPSC